MDTGNENSNPPVKCEQCLNEVPLTEAVSAEANDYVAHFCGLDCLQQWRQRARQQLPGQEWKRGP